VNIAEIKDALLDIVTDIEAVQEALDEYDDDDGEDEDDEDRIDVQTTARGEFFDSLDAGDGLVEGVTLPEEITPDTVCDDEVVLVVTAKVFNLWFRELIVE
jgi:hypothetical protein